MWIDIVAKSIKVLLLVVMVTVAPLVVLVRTLTEKEEPLSSVINEIKQQWSEV